MILLFALLGCRPPQLQAIGESVGTGVSIGWAAAVAANADQPSSPPCVQRTETCQDEPCAGAVVIDLSDPLCAFPLGDVTTGRIEAVGTWTGDEAILALRFLDMNIDGGSLFAPGISAVTATRDEEGTKVIYVDQSIEGIQTGDVEEVSQSAWVVDVDLSQGAAGAVMRINGGGQRVDIDGEIVQLASVLTVMDATCRQNPTEGLVTMERVEGADAGITGVTFHESCDGLGKLEASLGLDVGNSQKSFPIDLWAR